MFDRKEIKMKAKESLKGNFGATIIISLVVLLLSVIPTIADTILGNDSILAPIITIIIEILTVFLSVGLNKFYMDVTTKGKGEIKTLFWGRHLYLKAFLISLLIGIATILGTLLFIVPGIIIALMYSQVYYVMIDNPDMGVFECLQKSSDIMKGHKWEYFVFGLSFLGWYLLIPITLGLGYFYVLPYTNTACVNYYVDLVEYYKIHNGISDNTETDSNE